MKKGNPIILQNPYRFCKVLETRVTCSEQVLGM